MRHAIRVAGVLMMSAIALGCGEADAPSPSSELPVASPEREAADPSRPNLLLITVDTTRADALTPYGQPLPTSPNIERLARRGVLFENATATNPETLPSHSSIFTGKWPFVHGVRSNSGYVLSERNRTLAEILSENGWVTAAEVAAPVLRPETQVTQGFQSYRGAESPGVRLKEVRYENGEDRTGTRMSRIGSDITDHAIDFVRANADRPFFLWAHYFDPHNPYAPPVPFNRRFEKAPYHGEVASADQQIGLLLAEIRRLGLEDRTLVVLSSDHGEGLMEHGEPSHSFFVYQSTMHVPLVFAGLPSLPRGLRVPALVRTTDIAPTVLELLSLPPLEGAQGTSLVPLMDGSASDLGLTGYGESTRFTASFGMPVLRYVRQGPWKYIHQVDPELYDVEADPHELQNLASARPDKVAELRGVLEEMIRSAPPAIDEEQRRLDADTAAQLMALGYVARSPVASIGDELEALELHGPDPRTRVDDIQVISKVGSYLWRGEYELALELILPMRERHPDSPYVMDLYGQTLIGLGRHDEGIQLLRQVLVREPENSAVAYSLASALHEDGKSEEAAALLEGLLARNPCDERVRMDQTEVLKALERYDDLVATLHDGAERCPEMLSNLNNYAWALATLPDADLRDGARALEMIRKVIRLEGAEEPDAAYLDTLAAALAETGDFDGAVETGARVLARIEAEDGPELILGILRAHLDAYRARRPVRDPEPAG